MKSSYELAMERLNKSAPAPKLSDDQKRRLTEIDSKFAAKIAEREIFLNDELAAARAKGDAEAVEQIGKQLVSERKSIAADREEKKQAIRENKSKG